MTIMRLGCWTSTAFMSYIHEQVNGISKGMAQKMATDLPFTNLAVSHPSLPPVLYTSTPTLTNLLPIPQPEINFDNPTSWTSSQTNSQQSLPFHPWLHQVNTPSNLPSNPCQAQSFSYLHRHLCFLSKLWLTTHSYGIWLDCSLFVPHLSSFSPVYVFCPNFFFSPPLFHFFFSPFSPFFYGLMCLHTYGVTLCCCEAGAGLGPS